MGPTRNNCSFRNLLISTVHEPGNFRGVAKKGKAFNAGPARAFVFPRRKKGESQRSSPKSLSLSLNDIKALFYMRQVEAASHLGISLTAMKNACRRVGVVRWPYSRQRPENPLMKSKESSQPKSQEPTSKESNLHVQDKSKAVALKTEAGGTGAERLELECSESVDLALACGNELESCNEDCFQDEGDRSSEAVGSPHWEDFSSIAAYLHGPNPSEWLKSGKRKMGCGSSLDTSLSTGDMQLLSCEEFSSSASEYDAELPCSQLDYDELDAIMELDGDEGLELEERCGL
eukprot:763199-Hanusia_phi.AAC.3